MRIECFRWANSHAARLLCVSSSNLSARILDRTFYARIHLELFLELYVGREEGLSASHDPLPGVMAHHKIVNSQRCCWYATVYVIPIVSRLGES